LRQIVQAFVHEKALESRFVHKEALILQRRSRLLAQLGLKLTHSLVLHSLSDLSAPDTRDLLTKVWIPIADSSFEKAGPCFRVVQQAGVAQMPDYTPAESRVQFAQRCAECFGFQPIPQLIKDPVRRGQLAHQHILALSLVESQHKAQSVK
jgi:hypothetical protein